MTRTRRTNWKHASDIPPRQRGLFLARQRRTDRACEHGHFGCSDRDGGPCSDELLGLIEAEAAKRQEGWLDRHRAADPHCTCNDCIAYEQRQAAQQAQQRQEGER